MANLLYRLGRFSARRAWLMIVGWALVMAAAAGCYLGFKATLASSFSIPGTQTAQVSSELARVMPSAAGASGTVVFQSASGSGFSTQQQSQIGALLTRVSHVQGVSAVTNPFTTQATLDTQRAQLKAGQQKIDQAQATLTANKTRLEAAQHQLDLAIAQAKASGRYSPAQFAAQQQQITAGLQQLAQGQKELDAQAQGVADGSALLSDADGIRLVSTDGRTAMGAVAFTQDAFTLPASVKQGVASELHAAHIDGVTINYSGTIATEAPSLAGPGELAGLAIAAIVLIVMMRALLPALTPVLSSLVGVGVGVMASLAFSGVATMSSVTPMLGVMLGLAVGIDYSLFILNRHRRQVLMGMPVEESIGVANGTAGNAVVFAGTTVIIALLALFVPRIPFLGVMGAVGAACVLVAVLVAVSLTPAILALMGTRVLGRTLRDQIGHPDHTTVVVKPMRTRTAIVGGVLAIVALLAVASPALSMRLGLPDDGAAATASTEYKAYKAVEAAFGPGANGTLVVVADLPQAVAASEKVSTELRVADAIKSHGNVAALAPIGTSENQKTIVFQVVPKEGPSSQSTQDLVTNIRAGSPLSDGTTLGVAGQASGNIDVSAKLADALPVYLAVVIGLSFIIMMVVFRSLLVPLIASAGYVLSLFAAFGGMTAVYQWGWLSDVFGVHDPGPLLSFAPIIIMGVLFGLAMDYQLFLVSGMREAHMHGMVARASIVAGLRNGQAVVTAAALIMISVFGGFMFSEMTMVRPLGFGLSFGVLFDAFAVRMVIVPALMHLVGGRAWWLPGWLDRILPNVDIEGAALERSHPILGQAPDSAPSDDENEDSYVPRRVLSEG